MKSDDNEKAEPGQPETPAHESTPKTDAAKAAKEDVAPKEDTGAPKEDAAKEDVAPKKEAPPPRVKVASTSEIETAAARAEAAKDETKKETKDEAKVDAEVSFAQVRELVDFESRPTSKVGWGIQLLVTIIGIVVLWKNSSSLVSPMLNAKAPPVIPTEELPGDKFRLSEPERREIFREFATAEIAERARGIAQNTWNGHAWSREDDRGYIERTTARAAAARHHCSLSQVYLVLDEGIREKWPGPDGKPLAATTPPFNPRTTW